jgi:hypothetical protein
MTAMMRSTFAILPLVLLLAGCRPAAPGTPAPQTDEDRLERLLAADQLLAEHYAALDRLAADLGSAAFQQALGFIAADSTAAPPARAHALLEIGRRGAHHELWAFDRALRAAQPAVRAAAVAAAGHLMPVAPTNAARVLARGLSDPDHWIQAKALEGLGDYDPDVLRDYLARAPSEELRRIAQELLEVAEARGAPLRRNQAGALSRSSGAGTVELRPARRWPGWDAEAGELWVALPGQAPALIARDVEAVRGVVPAFFSPDGEWLVYEAGRRIRVRQLRTGAERDLGPGLAPRLYPLSQNFLYFVERERERLDGDTGVRLWYDVRVAGFDGGEPDMIWDLEAEASMAVHGNYSPLRWARIRHDGRSFRLEGDNMEALELPLTYMGDSEE